jgi:hypothetical protein
MALKSLITNNLRTYMKTIHSGNKKIPQRLYGIAQKPVAYSWKIDAT